MPTHKRAASSSFEEPRRSRRISSTSKKSHYFDNSDNSDEDESFEDDAPAKRGVAKNKAKTPTKAVKKVEEVEDTYEDEEPEEEEEEEDDKDEEPRVTFIPLVKLRPLDGIDYEDEKLHKNTMLFLKDLKAHNQRPWLKSHDGEYRRSLTDWQSFVETMTTKITEVDFTIPELPSKDVIFRIHRDIRFSKDPTPYKPHYSAAWSRTGRKGPYACYYVHCEPGHSFIGGGLWHPEAAQLQKLRESIDERPRRWRRVLNDPRFKQTFLPKVAAKAKDEAALKAFAETNKENALKTKPKGYLADHRDIELLKLRNFTTWKKLDDSIFTADDAQEKLVDIMSTMVGFVTFLNSIVMPDPNADDEESEDEENE